MSDPISITVEKAESLSLDAIVGKQRQNSAGPKDEASAMTQVVPDFTNDSSTESLVSQSPAGNSDWWWFFVIAPPIAWLSTVLVRHRACIGGRLPDFRSAKTRCLTAMEHAKESSEVVTALMRYIEGRTRYACSTSTIAIGALPTA